MTASKPPAEGAPSKRCVRCDKVLPVSEFYRDKRYGYKGACKSCVRGWAQKYEKTTRGKAWRKRYRAARADLPVTRAAFRRGAKTKAAKSPEKERAKRLVRDAIKRRALVRPDSCSRCGTVPPRLRDGRPAIHGHHHDYSKPLDVRWLCVECHVKQHAEEAANV